MLDRGGVGVVERLLVEQRARGITVLATNVPEEIRHGDLVLDLGGTLPDVGQRDPRPDERPPDADGSASP
jgi:hypothetical protein